VFFLIAAIILSYIIVFVLLKVEYKDQLHQVEKERLGIGLIFLVSPVSIVFIVAALIVWGSFWLVKELCRLVSYLVYYKS